MESIDQDMYTPICDDAIKPMKGRCFATLDLGIDFYKKYARAVGFDIRLSSARKSGDTLIWRYIVCSREGEKHAAADDFDGDDEVNKNRRRRVSMRCGCPAKVVFKFDVMLGYVVNRFIEQHNHPLVGDQYKHFMKLNRNLDHMHQKFILDCARANIGPTHSYKLLSELLGGHEAVGCSIVDVRNFSRDMKAYVVEGSDAQMLLNELCRKKEMCQAFTFDYEVDSEDKLKRVFWCDPISRRNYHMFGDVVAFDTTYSTNKYCMIFAPFTGIDNHGRPITFAAGLLSNEDAASFSWLFQKFVSCMGSTPSLIITDQDLGMKVAVERVLIGTRHRWCMWHIMLKLADKVSKELHADEGFKKELNSVVWSELIEPHKFEKGWSNIMVKYGLVEHDWFKSMFEAREFWIPVYFRDFPMSGLVRTTSISECENSFYKKYTRSRSNLLEFWMNFNHALETQRHSFSHLNYLDQSVLPTLQTKLPIEKHAATLYSTMMFSAVQEEIYASCFNCCILDMCMKDSVEEYKIKDGYGQNLTVIYSKDDGSFVCGCKLFRRKGILCRHIFFVFKNKDMNCIPDKYVVGRWRKLADVSPVHDAEINDVDNYVSVSENQQLKNKIMSSIFSWMQVLDGKIEKMTDFLARLNDVGELVSGQTNELVLYEKMKAFEDYYGASVPEKVDVRPPDVVKTKGSGSRIISRKEKAMKLLNKPLRRCGKCKQLTNHDSRNCDKVGKKIKI